MGVRYTVVWNLASGGYGSEKKRERAESFGLKFKKGQKEREGGGECRLHVHVYVCTGIRYSECY